MTTLAGDLDLGLYPELDLDLMVYGTPQPGGSKRAFVVKSKSGGKPRAVVTDDAKRSRPWKTELLQAVGKEMEGRPLLEGPLEVWFTFFARRPKGHYGSGRNAGVLKASAPRWPDVRPDALKLARAVEDALSGVVYRDDAQIVLEHLEKRYGTPEGVRIQIRRLTNG